MADWEKTIDVNFTAVGHFSAIVIGLLFHPMARGRYRRVAVT